MLRLSRGCDVRLAGCNSKSDGPAARKKAQVVASTPARATLDLQTFPPAERSPPPRACAVAVGESVSEPGVSLTATTSIPSSIRSPGQLTGATLNHCQSHSRSAPGPCVGPNRGPTKLLVESPKGPFRSPFPSWERTRIVIRVLQNGTCPTHRSNRYHELAEASFDRGVRCMR